MTDLITTDQFERRTGRTLSATQSIQVEALIADASALVVDIVNDSTITDTWTDATVPASIVPVVVAMVRRGIENPNGYRQVTAGPFSHSVGATSATGVFATRDEVRAIRKAAGTSGVAALNLDSYLVGRVSWLDGAL